MEKKKILYINKFNRLGTDVGRREDYRTGNYNITWENDAHAGTRISGKILHSRKLKVR